LPAAEKKHVRNPWNYLPTVRDIKSEVVNETLLSTLYCSIPETVALRKPKVIFSTSTHGYSMQTLFSRVEEHDATLLLIKTTSSTDEILGAYLSTSWSERREADGYFGTGETFIFSLLPEANIYKWAVLQEKSYKEDEFSQLRQKQHNLPPVKPPGGANKGGKGITLPPIHHDSPMNPASTSVSKVSQEPVVLPPLVGTACASPLPQQQRSSTSIKCEKNDMFMLADDSGLVVGGGKGYGLFLDADLRKGYTQPCTTFNNQPLVAGGSFICATVEVIGFD